MMLKAWDQNQIDFPLSSFMEGKHWSWKIFIPSLSLFASLVAQTVKCLHKMWGTLVQSLGWKDLLEKEMATHSSNLAWKIPRMEEPGKLQSVV